MATAHTNWAGNIEYSTRNVFYPETVEEVQRIVNHATSITALGSKHSFNTIADNETSQISLERMNRVLSIDQANSTVTIQAGVRYSDLAPYLHNHGYALENMASLPHITVAGACATATHGSGLAHGCLSTSVVGVEFVEASGNLIRLHKGDADFDGAVVALGALGVVTRLTIAIQPTFQMKQVVYRNLPMEQLKDNFDTLQAKGYSISLFTDWRNKQINEIWIISKMNVDNPTPEDIDLYGAKLATEKTHPVEGHSVDPLTEQLGIPGPWFERMPHFKVGFQPSIGSELQSEYYIPIERAYEAIDAMEKIHEKISPHLYISEIRTVGADRLWMSPCYKRACVAIHTTYMQKPAVVSEIIPLVEKTLAPFGPVPHWAKLFTLPAAEIHPHYEKLDQFRELARKFDPHGKFQNEYLKRVIFTQ